MTPKDVLSLKDASAYLAMDESTLAGLAAHATTPVVAVPPNWDAPTARGRVVAGIKEGREDAVIGELIDLYEMAGK